MTDEQKEALQEAIGWANDDGLPGTADMLRSILQAARAPQSATVDAHTVWAAAQLLPGEGIEDGVARIEALSATGTAEPIDFAPHGYMGELADNMQTWKASDNPEVDVETPDYLAPQPARQGMGDDAPGAEQLERALHYPDHWDTAAYPDVYSALREVMAHFTCECEATPQSAVLQDSAVRDAWVSVDERLPERTGEFYAVFNGGVVGASQFYGGKWAQVFGVTHWQPLPAAPTDALKVAK